MDRVLISYLQSGKAWVLVGAGPSVEMGYPSWEQLASYVIDVVKAEQRGTDPTKLDAALRKQDYPRVFQEAENILGGAQLLEVLRERLKPTHAGRIYELITQWPVPVYLTTNYDNELQKHLASLGMSFLVYSNSEQHLGSLIPDLDGAIFKLHGDLRAEEGLILTTTQYREISGEIGWQYWRTKMTSVFQLNPMIVIGHSLSDSNIRHVLEAAKKGAGVVQPVCWIAPDVSSKQCSELLYKYRIRVIPYDNSDGQHKNLVKLVENLSQFVPPRPVIHIQKQIERISASPLGANAGAPGFFVFNAFARHENFEDKRIDVVTSAIQSILPELNDKGVFTLQDALEMSGWPKDLPLQPGLAQQVGKRAIKQQLLTPMGDKFRVNPNGMNLAIGNRASFDHMRERFKQGLFLRTKRDYADLGDERAKLIASDTEQSLVGYFREGGLSLASTLFSADQRAAVPSSIIPFIQLASARYDDLLMRQAFFTVSVDIFVHPESADRDYLGRISQGFFAFHVLGVFGDAAIERLNRAKETVWLVDSDTQIRALALAAPTSNVYRECLSTLHGMGLRFFTTASLFSETCSHVRFADKVVSEHGPTSHMLLAAARGETPYPKSNQFLEGFIRWQAAGNPCDWHKYLYQIFGYHDYSDEYIKKTLEKIGVEVIEVRDWPGFIDSHYYDIEQYTQTIARLSESMMGQWNVLDIDSSPELYKKAKPEAEAFNIVRGEHKGVYYMISSEGKQSPSWFISYTSILNLVEPKLRVTWQPGSFLSFASTLCDVADTQSSDHAFDILLLGLAESGLNLLDDDIVARVFGSVIDQTKLSIEELRQVYDETLAQKYGEPIESVMRRIAPVNRPLALIQLANEAAEIAAMRQRIAEETAKAATKRADSAEKELLRVEKYRKKMLKKQSKLDKSKRKGRKSSQKKKRRRS